MRCNLLAFSAAGEEESLQLSVSTHKVRAAVAEKGPAQSTSSNEPAESCNKGVEGVVRRYVQMYGPGTEANEYRQEGLRSSVPSPFGGPQPHRSSVVHAGVEEWALESLSLEEGLP
ncbi:nad-dependent dehydratase [Lasius niger]|uniref:Nad-dependent dehydratase n=1 Tax=Lasius niger TaxID=67767 RepID=A0A0J7K0M2_LASNI|nr:nad-dependent dehydratase [Lasius niger]